MSEYSFPNLKQARFRDRSYQTNIVRNSVELTENQKILGNGLNYHVITYGCQANVRDGEVISGILEKMGYSYTEAFSQADIIILNTCAIRDNAEKKVLGEIGFLQSYKRKNPNMIIGLCGCMAQEEKVVETLTKKYPYVELIFGTHNINDIDKIAKFAKSKKITNPTLVVPMDIRHMVFVILAEFVRNITVLAHEELVSDYNIKFVGKV